MAKKHDNSTFENAADKAVMDDLAERRALGEDVFGDEDGEDAAAAAKAKALANDAGSDEGAAEEAADEIEAAADGDAEEAAAEEGAKDEPAQDAKDEAAAEEQAPVELVDPVQFRTVSKEEFETQRKALRAEKNEAFKKLSAGEISEDQFLEVQDRVDDQLMELTSKHALMEANEQTRQRAQEAKLTQIRTDAKKAGLIDYNDGDAAQEFDAALQFVAAVKANAKLGFEELADKAHEMVLAQRGLAAKPAAPAQRRAPAVPPSLSRLPAAATPNGAGGVGEQLGRLDGLDFQEAIGRMPRQQRDAYLDS